MRRFEMHELQEAIVHAAQGGQALHLHNVIANRRRAPRCFVRAVDRGEQIAHLFDQDAERLRETAYLLGVDVIRVEREGMPGQHIDLCDSPLRRALDLCKEGAVADITRSEWRLQARAIIEQVLAGLPAGSDLKVKKAAIRQAYPYGPREHHPYRMWCLEVKRALGAEPGPLKTKLVKGQTVIRTDGIFCDWCQVVPNAGCMACMRARVEWPGARVVVSRFPPDAPAGIVADALEEAGFDACARLLRKYPGDFA